MLTFAIFYSFESHFLSWGTRKGADISSHQFVFGGGVAWGGWVSSIEILKLWNRYEYCVFPQQVLCDHNNPGHYRRSLAELLKPDCSLSSRLGKLLDAWPVVPMIFTHRTSASREKEQNTNVWTIASGVDPASNWEIYKNPMACPRSHLSGVYKLHFSL